MTKLTKLAIVLAIIAVIGIMFGTTIAKYTGMYQAAATKSAYDFHEAMYPGKPIKAVCMAYDTDNDGYIGCSIQEPVTGDLLPIECTYNLLMVNGCKAMYTIRYKR